MGTVAKLFPYRIGNTLMFRGIVGADGTKVSKFFPIRVSNGLVLRGKDAAGKVLYGWPYRSGNTLMARTRYGPTCNKCDPCSDKVWKTGTAEAVISSFSCPDATYLNTLFNGTYNLPVQIIPGLDYGCSFVGYVASKNDGDGDNYYMNTSIELGALQEFYIDAWHGSLVFFFGISVTHVCESTSYSLSITSVSYRGSGSGTFSATGSVSLTIPAMVSGC